MQGVSLFYISEKFKRSSAASSVKNETASMPELCTNRTKYASGDFGFHNGSPL
jgi:hypothetical protein